MPNSLTIVAIGDSLTVGFIPMGTVDHPYTRFLTDLIEGYLLRNDRALNLQLVNRGINGDLTSNMLLRFQYDVCNLDPDCVIVFGGTNDLGWGFSVEEIFANLKEMYEQAIANNIEPIGCTIPSVLGWDAGIPPRLELNQSILRHCAHRQILCADLFTQTCHPQTKRLRAEYASDGLHLNALGYMKLAETIFHQALTILLARDLDKPEDE